MTLTVLIATYNRRALLEKTITAIRNGTKTPIAIVVIDGGSTDETHSYLRAQPQVTTIVQTARLGTAKSYNAAWRRVRSHYSCWLSDDTEITPGSLDRAVEILQHDETIGMVGLKMKDTTGPWQWRPYMGAVSEYGILNCNHGVLPTALVCSVGFFNEQYRSYMIDPDLTASILSAGKKVVMTKSISVLHQRDWSATFNEHERQRHIENEMKGKDNAMIYRNKFRYLSSTSSSFYKKYLISAVNLGLEWVANDRLGTVGMISQDIRNYLLARFIQWNDPVRSWNKQYHLIQEIPQSLLHHPLNPYRHLL